MRTPSIVALAGIVAWALIACAPATEQEAQVPGSSDTQPFSAIGEGERLRFVGTEPFWGGEVAGTALRYSTPEQPEGTMLSVERFAGRGGLSYAGTLAGAAFDMAVTPGECSDGMSDHVYPFTVTLRLGDGAGEELRNGCGWTDTQPFAERPAG